MIPDDLKINHLVEVEIDKNQYPSRVEGISSSNIYVAIPMVNGALLPVYPGDEVQISYTVKKEYNQLITCSFTSRICGRERSPIPVMILELPANVQKAQRRSYLRIPVNLRCRYVLRETGEEHEGVIVDLSGGGCMLQTGVPIEPGTLVDLKLTLPDKPMLEIVGQVIRAWQREETVKMNHFCGLEFIQIRESHRDIIIKYLVDVQRNNIKKRRI